MVGLASFPFARHYLGNRCFFLFLRLLRCFSSPGSLPYVMDWRMDDWSSSSRVSPFRYLRINGYLLLPEAFRSLSRLSSALSAKASTLRSCSLNQLSLPCSVTAVGLGFYQVHRSFLIHYVLWSTLVDLLGCLLLKYLRKNLFLCMRFSRYILFRLFYQPFKTKNVFWS